MDFKAESLNIQGLYHVQQSRRLNDQRRRQHQNEEKDDEKDERADDVIDLSTPETAESDSVGYDSESQSNLSDTASHTINILVE